MTSHAFFCVAACLLFAVVYYQKRGEWGNQWIWVIYHVLIFLIFCDCNLITFQLEWKVKVTLVVSLLIFNPVVSLCFRVRQTNWREYFPLLRSYLECDVKSFEEGERVLWVCNVASVLPCESVMLPVLYTTQQSDELPSFLPVLVQQVTGTSI